MTNLRVLHVLSQRPGHTGSGTLLRQIAGQAAEPRVVRGGEQGVAQGVGREVEQKVIVGVPTEDPAPAIPGVAPADVHPLVFGAGALPFPLPGMSDVMPYPSTVFAEMDETMLRLYRDAWREHVGGVLAGWRPDVIHSHHVWLLSSMLKDLAPATPVVTHCHGTGLRQLELCPHLAREVVTGCRRNERLLALHNVQAAAIRKVLDLLADRVDVVGGGYRDDLFRAAPGTTKEPRSLAYAGKLSRAKGLHVLLDVVEELMASDRDPHAGLRLHVAGGGSGAEADALRERMARLAPFVEWHGPLDQERLAALLQRCAVFVLPSFFEGLPLVLAEALACDCRVVCTRLPGVAEAFRDLPHDVFHAIEPPAMAAIDEPAPDSVPGFRRRLADAVRYALATPPLRSGAEYVRNQTRAAFFRRIEAAWCSVMRGGST